MICVCVVLRVRNKYYYIIMLACLHPVTMQLGSVHFFCHLESETGFRLKSKTGFVNQIRPRRTTGYAFISGIPNPDKFKTACEIKLTGHPLWPF